MNIIETISSLLLEFPKINEVCNDIHIDFTDNEATNYGISFVNDVKLSSDILGNQSRQSSFILYAVYQSINDYDRLNNSGVLYELQMYLENVANGQPITTLIDDKEYMGKLKKINCSNGMLFDIPLENETCAWRYQLQISAQYAIESEEF